MKITMNDLHMQCTFEYFNFMKIAMPLLLYCKFFRGLTTDNLNWLAENFEDFESSWGLVNLVLETLTLYL